MKESLKTPSAPPPPPPAVESREARLRRLLRQMPSSVDREPGLMIKFLKKAAASDKASK